MNFAPLDIAVAVLLLVGSIFYVIGAAGLVRMPDVFTRLHASSIMETLGAGSLLVGMMFAAGWSIDTVKLAVILGTLIYTGPVATHALARAALTARVEPILAEDRTGKGKQTSAVKDISMKEAEERRPESSREKERKAKKGGKSSKR